ncbi:tetratricopeptide repeat protein [Pseudomonas borbori]
MIRTGRALILGCLMLVPSLAFAGGNSLLIPATGSCSLNTSAEDLPDAIAACEQAARKGDLQAGYELGEFFYQGKQGEQNLQQALDWFEQASLQGHARAQYRLGMMFFLGEGVPANNVQAYIVLKMAAVNGSDEAMDSADMVSAQMQREEFELAAQVLGDIFRSYLMELQAADGMLPFSPQP